MDTQEAGDDDFFIDTQPATAENEVKRAGPRPLPKYSKEVVQKALEKARLTEDFDKKPISEVCAKSTRAKKRENKAVRESTAGKGWFGMPATEVTEETKRDLELLHIRAAIDPKSQYRSNDRDALPKYFQKGRVVDNAADFYSSRVPRAQRRQTMVDELMDDYSVLARSKRHYSQIKARESQTRKRHSLPMSKFSKRKKRQ